MKKVIIVLVVLVGCVVLLRSCKKTEAEKSTGWDKNWSVAEKANYTEFYERELEYKKGGTK